MTCIDFFLSPFQEEVSDIQLRPSEIPPHQIQTLIKKAMLTCKQQVDITF